MMDRRSFLSAAALGIAAGAVPVASAQDDHGVDPAYIRGMADVGYKEVPLDALIRMRDHGVDPAFVRRVQQSGLGHLSVDQLIERRDHGMNDPDAAARAVVSNVRSLWRSVVAWMQS